MSSSDAPILELSHIDVHRGAQHVVRDVSLTVTPGAPFAIVGESGAGKTSLLMAAAGLLRPTRGTARVAGRDVYAVDRTERARLLGLVFQEYHLFPHLTVAENVTLAPRLQQDPAARERGLTLLRELGLGDLSERGVQALSGGQKQRVAIARSLALEPRVLFFDEPSAALDEKTGLELASLLTDLATRIQVVIVSHDRTFLEGCCPRGAKLASGRLVAEGPLGNLFAEATG